MEEKRFFCSRNLEYLPQLTPEESKHSRNIRKCIIKQNRKKRMEHVNQGTHTSVHAIPFSKLATSSKNIGGIFSDLRSCCVIPVYIVGELY